MRPENNIMEFIDFYKADHKNQYPKGTNKVYSNLTPRSNRYGISDKMVFFGLQYFIMKHLVHNWNVGFFDRNLEDVLSDYKRRMDTSLGKDAIDVSHIRELHELGYLPLEIKALKEGTRVPMRVPALTISNTVDKFFWLTNYLESLMSAELWGPSTSASTAFEYRKEFERHAKLTGYSDWDFTQFQGHDFSFRGMMGVEAAMMSGAGHLLSFTGTDTVSSLKWLEYYYKADAEKELIGTSVPATEHSIMCMGTIDGEIDTFKKLITETYPSGIVSIVSDTWDYWKVITEFLPKLKDEIMNRKGGFPIDRVVIRPDSGNPVDIICGDVGPWNVTDYEFKQKNNNWDCHQRGTYEMLWETFGGTINEQGYKVLDSHIGLIYGDSITFERQKEILKRLEAKGFSASNLVLGIGSYTYQYVTRDSYGTAVKATYGEVDGVGRNIFKDPKTDDGMKKSAKGLLAVIKPEGGTELQLEDELSIEEYHNEFPDNLLELVWKDGKFYREQTLQEIRDIVKEEF